MTLALWTRRRARRVITVLIIAASGLGLLGATSLGAAGASDSKAPTYHLVRSHFGLAPGTGFFFDDAHLRAGLSTMNSLGVHWIRSSIPWAHIQPTDPAKLAKGESEYDWKRVDELMATLRSSPYKGKFSLIVTIDSPPAWAEVNSRVAHVSCTSQPPFDLASYARAAAAIAAHVKSVAHVFEIENSPNIAKRSTAHADPTAVWPTPNPCAYAQLMTLTTAAVHKAAAGSTVLVGGIGGTRDIPNQRMAADEFLYGLYVNHAKFDGVAYHPYSTPNLPCAPTKPQCTFDSSTKYSDNYGMHNGWNRMLHARQVMVAFGDSAKKIWITEFGGPTKGPAKVLTESQQANLLTAGFQRASQEPWIAEMCWFTFTDKGGDVHSDPTGGWMGLIQANGTHKASFGAYVRLANSAK
jgi:hypothetical protein